MKKLAALTLSLFLCMGTALADSPKDSPKDPPKEADAQPGKNATAAKAAPAKSNAEIAAEMEELRQALQAQQEQLQMLKEELAKRDRQIEEAREAAAAANSRATEANVKASEAAATSAEVKTTTSELNSSVASLAASSAAASGAASSANPSAASNNPSANPMTTSGAQGDEEKGPLTIRFKGINITPGGFLAAETVNRTRAMSDDINTQFNAIPFGGNSVGKLPEMSLTARQSRLSLLAESKVGETKLTGYYEADFLGTGVTSNNRQSNSYVFRQRQVFGRADFASGWAITGGQMWSLATENRTGTVNRTEWIPQTIDPQYVVGFTWLRDYGLRVSKTWENKVTFATEVGAPQATVGGRGFSTYTNTSATGTVTTYQNSFVFAPGAGGGLENFSDTTGYAINKTPDFILKMALDPGFGHYELFGIASTFQDRVYPCAVVGTTAKNFPTPTTPTTLACAASTSLSPGVAGAYNDSRTGGGVGGSAALPLANKKFNVGLKVFYGDGTGRYGSAQLADATLRPDGTMALVHGAHWLGRVEWAVTPKLDLYGYVGGEYAARTAYKGYDSVKVVNTPAIPGCGAAGQQPCAGGGVQPAYPALTTTTITLNGIGGYGSPFSNNTGCSTETLPSATGTPGTGGTCAGDTRYIMEGTLGFWRKVYQGEKGRMQWGIQYSYIYRNTWSGSGGTLPTGVTSISPHAVNNMVFTSFRYYLP
ncbi:MAG TPA: hypothetical protein VEJ47_07840 [Candidatus Eremiobacteraceae bacterium]|nr:hypothetical protein [Candidatus Eremiobacteraceae bacterium]